MWSKTRMHLTAIPDVSLGWIPLLCVRGQIKPEPCHLAEVTTVTGMITSGLRGWHWHTKMQQPFCNIQQCFHSGVWRTCFKWRISERRSWQSSAWSDKEKILQSKHHSGVYKPSWIYSSHNKAHQNHWGDVTYKTHCCPSVSQQNWPLGSGVI